MGKRVLNPGSGKIRVLGTMCATCIFRPGNLMHLADGQRDALAAEAVARQTHITCHDTLVHDTSGAVCRGFFDRHRMDVWPLRTAAGTGLIDFVEPSEKGTKLVIKPTRERVLAAFDLLDQDRPASMTELSRAMAYAEGQLVLAAPDTAIRHLVPQVDLKTLLDTMRHTSGELVAFSGTRWRMKGLSFGDLNPNHVYFARADDAQRWHETNIETRAVRRRALLQLQQRHAAEFDSLVLELIMQDADKETGSAADKTADPAAEKENADAGA